MLRPMGRLFLTVAVAGGLLLLAPLFKAANIGGVAYAQTQNPFQNAYFDDSVGGGTVSIVNPTETPLVCALIYVFDAHEQLQECCGCIVTHSGGLRTIRIANQLSAVGFSATPPSGEFNTLTDNPFDNVFISRGVIKIISSLPNGKAVCDPTAAADPVDALRASATAFQVSEFNPTGGADDTDVIGVTEHKFAGGPDPSVATAGASESESAALQDLCVGVQEFGSGQGVCGCGVGDVTPH